MTISDAIHDVKALLEFFEERNGAVPMCLEYCLKLLNEQAGWILVDEGLPEKSDVYLVTWKPKKNSKRNFLALLEFLENGEWADDIPQAKEYGGYEIVAWMPSPDPYEEDE